MEGNGGSKITGIKQIVRLKAFLQKWQNATLRPKEKKEPSKCHRVVHSGISPAISLRLKNSNVYSDSDEEGCQSPEALHGVPRGYLAVYVGPELRRFIIPTSYLSNPLFKVLLEKVEEEFGYDHSGALTIPCEVETFKYLLKCMENQQRDQAEELNKKDAVSITEERL